MEKSFNGAPPRNTRLVVSLDRVETAQDDLLKIAAEGTFRGEPAQAEFVGAPLTLLFTTDTTLPIDIEARLADTEAAANGNITALGKTSTSRFRRRALTLRCCPN